MPVLLFVKVLSVSNVKRVLTVSDSIVPLFVDLLPFSNIIPSPSFEGREFMSKYIFEVLILLFFSFVRVPNTLISGGRLYVAVVPVMNTLQERLPEFVRVLPSSMVKVPFNILVVPVKVTSAFPSIFTFP